MNINTSQIRSLLRGGRSVVLVEDGQDPLVVTELEVGPREEVVPIVRTSARPNEVDRDRPSGDQIMERLNKEILALKEQIEHEEAVHGQ